MDPNTAAPQAQNTPPIPEEPKTPAPIDPVAEAAQEKPVSEEVSAVVSSTQPSVIQSQETPPQEQIAQPPQPEVAPHTEKTPKEPKKSSPLFVIALILLLVVVLGLGGYFVWTKYFNKTEVTPTPSPVAEVISTPTPDPTADWKTYTNTAVGFSVRYPSDWRLVGTETSTDMIGFGPANVGEDVLWGINIYGDKTADQIVADMGKQFSTDRKVQQEQITINGFPATKVTVTTSSLETWVFQQILITSSDKIIAISNGAIVDSNFDSFYDSFKFIEATSSATP